MQNVIRSFTLAVAVLSVAGAAVAAQTKAPAAKHQAAPQPANAAATKPAKTKAAAPTTLVATGKIVTVDAGSQALTLSTSKGEQHFTVGPTARLQDSSHTITVADLGKLTGHKATVRYKESGGEKSVESIRVSSNGKASTKG